MSTADIPPAPTAQAKYQVRFDWGVAGAARIAPGADVVVWVDVLGPGLQHTGGHEPSGILDLLPTGIPVLGAGFTTASATARWITDLQHRLGRRAMIAILAAGEPESGQGLTAGVRFAVEDQLAAGAVIDALATLGTDYCSPEAAASCAAFTGLRGAVAHLLTASASAQQLVAAGVAPALIRAAGALDTEEQARLLRG
ncbi:hypothetical protein [Microterricola viridarii]|uniref:2-phosphosulfolactate phosphatase n=1 Tax=Microterricola viridarii TaxID=412690 RepID=A0A1H1PUD8_9MICO|nr:hypothetical protein [Microterricola viridarii]SDS14339.1 hypothetical protein SAMN04489834_0940 [Microterricola viridarii]